MAEDYTLANPIDHTKVGDLPDEIRNVKALVVSGAMRFFWQATAPTTRYEGTAFSADDLGSIWIDSDDNRISILTATTPTWTAIDAEFLAAAREIAFADATLTLKNTDAENTDGGRQSRLIIKGVQDGDEETTLGYIEIAHKGTSDDEQGRLQIVLNDGNDGDAPSAKVLTAYADDAANAGEAFIDVTNSEIVLDENDMASDSDKKLATQQSIVAYIASIRALSAYTNEDSDNTAMLKTHAYKAATDGLVKWWAVPGTNKSVEGFVGLTNDPAGAGTRISYFSVPGTQAVSDCFPVAKDEYFELTTDGTATIYIYWKSIGTLSKPIDQEA